MSSPHSHGWMSVTRPACARVALAVAATSGTRRASGNSSARNSRPFGGWRRRAATCSRRDRDEWRLRDARRVDVARARAAFRFDCQTRAAPDVLHARREDHVRQHAVGPLAAEQRAELAGRARAGRTRASPMAMKHESHSHWCGYSDDDGHVQVPRLILRASTACACSTTLRCSAVVHGRCGAVFSSARPGGRRRRWCGAWTGDAR